MGDSGEETLNQYPVEVRLRVRWGDMDAFQHVNNTVFFKWFEDARIAYFEASGVLGYRASTRVGPILAASSCRFRRPVTWPDHVRVGARVEDVQEDRFTMGYCAVSEATGEVVATGDGLVVCYDYDGEHKAPLPEPILEGIRRVEATRRT